MKSYPINPNELNSFYTSFKELKKSLISHEYRSGFIQRLKDGFGIIHTPRRTLPYGDQNTEILLSLFSDNKGFPTETISNILGKELTLFKSVKKIFYYPHFEYYQLINSLF